MTFTSRTCKVLAALEDRIDLARSYAYEVLLDLARPWTVSIRLVGAIHSRPH